MEADQQAPAVGPGCRPLVAVVGVCAAGKSTLVRNLRACGWNARQVLQEHSYAPRMWQIITRPDLLVYLDASLETIRQRRNDATFPAWLLAAQRERLRHARQFCDVYLMTDTLTPDQVLANVLRVLQAWREAQGSPAPTT